jgi:hypothetical protein
VAHTSRVLHFRPDPRDSGREPALHPVHRPRFRLRVWRRLTTRRWLLWTLGSIVVLLVAARLAAPTAVRWYIDRTINSTPGYQGGVGEVGLHLWRGAYRIDNVVVSRVGSGNLDPFFTCASIDLAVGWRNLMRGSLTGTVHFDHPVVNFADAKDERNRQTGDDRPAPESTEKKRPEDQPDQSGKQEQDNVSWQEQVQKLMPFAIDRVDVVGGKIRFQNIDKRVDIHVGKLNAVITNLTNTRRLSSTDSLVSTLKAEGATVGGGSLSIDGDIDPFATDPTFTVRVKLEHLDLPAINELTKAYANVDIERGTLDLYADIAAHDGRISGYVKPIFHRLDVLDVGSDRKKGDPLHVFWEAIVGATGKILRNQPKDQLATEIPIAGRIDAPGTNVIVVIGGVLKNAFVRALLPGFRDHEKAHEPDLEPPQDARKGAERERAAGELEENAAESTHVR